MTVTNERDLGTIAVEKVAVGDPAGRTTTATVVVDCPGTDYDQTLTVPPGETVETGEIPTLLECAISEPNPPPGWDVTIDPDHRGHPGRARTGPGHRHRGPNRPGSWW